MNRQEQNKLIRAKSALEDCFYNGNIKKYNLTQTEAHEAFNMLMIVRTGNSADTIMEGVMKFFERCKFTIKTNGIGWTITL